MERETPEKEGTPADARGEGKGVGAVEAFLRNARRRIALRRHVRGAALAIALGAVAYVLGALGASVAALVWNVERPTAPEMLVVAGGVSLLAVIVSAAAVSWRIPSLLDVARIVDAHMDAKETFSTAWEYRNERSAFTSHVYDEAHAMARRLSLHRRFAIDARGPSLAILAAGMTIAGTYVALDGGIALTQGERRAGEAAGTTANSVNLNRDEVSALASEVGAEAERRSDPYLEALARELRDRARQASAAPEGQDSSEIPLDDLVGHLARAYDVSDDAMAQRLQGDAGPSEARRGAEAESDEAERTDSRSAERGSEDRDRADRDRGDGPRPEASSSDGGSESDANDEASARSADANELGDRVAEGDYFELSAEAAARVERERRARERMSVDLPAGGDMGGAGKGASQQAGMGERALMGEESLPQLGEEGQAQDDFELPVDPEAGARIEVEAPPDTNVQRIEETSLDGGGWTRFDEAAMRREPVDRSDSGVARRYFLPEASDEAER